MTKLKNKTPTPTGENKTRPSDVRWKILNIVGLILCVILLPILVMNCILIVKGLIYRDKVPAIGGYAPLIVLTESMEDTILAGDLIICKEVSADEIEVGDVISFFDPESNSSAVVTHRVIAVETDEDGNTYFRTQGDDNDIADRTPVPAENLVGEWTGTRFVGLGYVSMFMQSTAGLVICICIPVAAVVVYEILRRKRRDREKQEDIDSLKAEITALRAAQTQNNDGGKSAETDGEHNLGESDAPKIQGELSEADIKDGS